MFNHLPYDAFMKWFNDGKPVRVMRRYTLGNPLIAQTMLKHDPLAGLHVPVDLMILGGPEGKMDEGAASIVYELPSSLMNIPRSNTELRKAATALDSKLEAMVRGVTGN